LRIILTYNAVADGDESIRQKKERRLEMARKRLANSEVVRDLHREYTDGPDEIRVIITLSLLISNGFRYGGDAPG